MKVVTILRLVFATMVLFYLTILYPYFGNSIASEEQQIEFIENLSSSANSNNNSIDTNNSPQVVDLNNTSEHILPAPPAEELRTHHHCLNSDFVPKASKAVWTMLNDNMAYTRGAVKMGRGVKTHTQTPIDLVVMELQSKPLSDALWKELKAVGFMRCTVESIPAPEKTRHDLKEKFAVLHVWAMTVYETVLFIDADTFVQNSLDDLINTDLKAKGKTIGVTKDIRGGKWVETFNSGVLLLHPDRQEHDRLIELLRSGIQFEFIMSDQGFLNEVYAKDWHEIGFLNNANLALYRFQREFWDQHKLEDINIIHYTMQKPWKCQSKGPYGPICDVWINAP